LKRQLIERVPDHMSIEVTAFTGVNLNRRDARRSNALRIVRCLLVAFDDDDRMPGLEVSYGSQQELSLAGSRARYEIECEYSGRGEADAILRGITVILRQQVALDLEDAVLAHPRHVHAGEPIAVMQRTFVVSVFMIEVVAMVGVTMIMIVRMDMSMRMKLIAGRAGLDPLVSAAANCAHHSTSRSLRRMSVPAVICNW